jgi:hypothetical protein
VRLEGDDPSTLSILLDASGSDADLMANIDDVIAGLSPTFLHPLDHVSVYALDCSLTRSLYDVPADSTQLNWHIGTNSGSSHSRRSNYGSQ